MHAQLRILRPLLLCSVAMLWVLPQPAAAQATSDPAAAPPPTPAPASSGGRVYTPADFARFAPKTAYDMLRQVPGFTIRQAAEEERGLGQASENVLINRQRITNKSESAVNVLQKTPAGNVERIEIVEAASLGIAGLTGQVANVVLKAQQQATGQFEWNTHFRPHFAKPELLGGSVSYSGRRGPVDYTFSAKNSYGRGGFGGPILLTEPDGEFIERRRERFNSEYEQLALQAKFGLDGPGSSIGNLTLGYTPYWAPTHIRDRRRRADGDHRRRTTVTKLDGFEIDLNGDYEFALGPGRLKLIGLRHFEHEPLVTTQILRFDSGADSTGTRLDRDTRIGETIARAEYGWKTGRNDWRITFERAFNSLDQRGKLFDLSPSGEFERIDFPNGTGKVVETRYEGLATLSRPLAATLDLQVAGGAETSTLERVDGDLPARKFFRPKGSVALAWRPAEGWDASLKLRRRVGQISFYDFLDQPKLSDDRENQGNPDLVPPQSWEAEGEIGRSLGAWGKTRLRGWHHIVQDIVDRIPIGEDGEGVGNLPRATRTGLESTSTIQFDPIGWTGAKLDATFGFERTRVKDPLTAERRPISGVRDRWISLGLRHDIPKTPFAWGVNADYGHYAAYYYPTEVFRSYEGPWFVGAFVEHKDFHGLTLRADFGNLLNGRHIFDRTVYEGRRNVAPIDFFQLHDQLIGPIFEFSVRGNF